MSKLEKFLPEGCYEFKNKSMRQLRRLFENNEMVVGYVFYINDSEQRIYVRLGYNIVGILPYSEVTIYPFEFSRINPNLTVPLQVIGLKNKIICAKIKKFDGEQIILSRKDNMLEAFEAIQNKEIVSFRVLKATPRVVYGDIGYGLQAKIYIENLCKSRLYSTTEVCNNGDCLKVKILSVTSLKKFDVSHKEAFPKYDPNNYLYGDIIIGRVNSEKGDVFEGLYIFVDPQVSGILDCDENSPELEYGDLVECTVYDASPSGLRLRFVKLIEKAK